MSVGGYPSVAAGGARVGAFGKTPRAADFLYYGPVDADTQAFRDWLEDGVSWASARTPDVWRLPATELPVFGFVFRAPGGNLVVGALRASSDSVGRDFPISAYVVLPGAGLGNHPHVLPLWLGELLQDAAGAVLADDVLGAVARLEVTISSGALLPVSGLHQDARDYAEWVDATELTAAFDTLFGEESRASAIQALHTIYEAILPFRGKERPKTPLSVRVPLGAAGAGGAAFWIDVVRHAAGWRDTVPTFFWSSQDGGGEAIVQLGDVPASSLPALWHADAGREHVCDLTHLAAADAARFFPLLPPAVATVLTRADARVSDLLNALHS
ncbi:MAG TPA: type VI secretion system-associated protein TagF [Polyangiaceae bacterium]|nr:type VI secretion system-associated protein TagF [Polyangiaceae bacterium]